MTVVTRSSVRIAGLSPNVVTYGSDGKPIYSKPGATTISTPVATSVTESATAPTVHETQTQEETPVESPGLITMQGTQEERDYNRGVKAYDALSKMIDEANKGNNPDAFTSAFEYARYHRGELENVVDAKELDALIWDLRDIPINQKKTDVVLKQIDVAAKQQDFAKARILAEQNRQLLEKTVGKTETTDYIKEIKKAENTPAQTITVKQPFVTANAGKKPQQEEPDEYGVTDLTFTKPVRDITEPTSEFLNTLMAPREKIKAGARAIGGKGLAGDALEAFGMFGEGAYRTIVPGTVEFVGQVPTAAEYVVRHPEKVPAATVLVGGKIVEGIKKEAVENPFGLAGSIAATVVASKVISKIPSVSKVAGATGGFIEEEANAFRFTREMSAVKAAAKGKSAPGILSDIADFGVGELKSGAKTVATKVVKAATSSPLPAVKRVVTTIKSPVKAEITAFKTFKKISNVAGEKPLLKNIADYGVARTVTKLERVGTKLKSSAYAADSTVREFAPVKSIKRQATLTGQAIREITPTNIKKAVQSAGRTKLEEFKTAKATTGRISQAVKKAFAPIEKTTINAFSPPTLVKGTKSIVRSNLSLQEKIVALREKTSAPLREKLTVARAEQVKQGMIVRGLEKKGANPLKITEAKTELEILNKKVNSIRSKLSSTKSFEERASALRESSTASLKEELKDARVEQAKWVTNAKQLKKKPYSIENQAKVDNATQNAAAATERVNKLRSQLASPKPFEEKISLFKEQSTTSLKEELKDARAEQVKQGMIVRGLEKKGANPLKITEAKTELEILNKKVNSIRSKLSSTKSFEERASALRESSTASLKEELKDARAEQVRLKMRIREMERKGVDPATIQKVKMETAEINQKVSKLRSKLSSTKSFEERASALRESSTASLKEELKDARVEQAKWVTNAKQLKKKPYSIENQAKVDNATQNAAAATERVNKLRSQLASPKPFEEKASNLLRKIEEPLREREAVQRAQKVKSNLINSEQKRKFKFKEEPKQLKTKSVEEKPKPITSSSFAPVAPAVISKIESRSSPQVAAQPNYQDYAPPKPQGSNYGYAGGRRVVVDEVDEYGVSASPKEKQKNRVIVRQEVTVAPALAMAQSQEFGLETRLKVKPAIESALSPKIAQGIEQGMRIGQATIQEPAQSQKIKQAILQQQGIKQVQKQAQKQREVQKPKQKQKIKAKPKVKPAEKTKIRAFPLAWSEEKSKTKFPKKKGSRVSVEFAPVEMPFENMGRRFKGQKKQKQKPKKKKSVKNDYGI